MKNVRPARLSAGEKIAYLRKKKNLSQENLAKITGIAQPSISLIENEKITLGLNRAKMLALALSCHPAELLFPEISFDWFASDESLPAL